MSASERCQIVVPGDFPPQVQGSPHLERLQPYGDLKLYDRLPAHLEEQIERCRKAEIVINSRGAVRWPAEALRACPRLRMIGTCSIGVDNIDLETARELGIVVSNQPGRTAPVVAEHMFGLMFAVAKRVAYQTAQLRAGVWQQPFSMMLQGKTLGVVGVGPIGAEMARLGSAIGMEVLAWTFHPSDERAAALGVRFVELDELLRSSVVVSLHLPLSDSTHHLIGERELALMPPGSILLNGARGAVVDSAALVAALNSGHLGGAGLDVFETEPLPADDPLLGCEQVALTPHCADQTPEGADLLNGGVVDNVIAFLEGNPRHNVA